MSVDRFYTLGSRGDSERRPQPELELIKVQIYDEDDEWTVHIRADLLPNDKSHMMYLIKQYKEIFAWSPADMPRIDLNVACHQLMINSSVKPVQQKKRNHGTE